MNKAAIIWNLGAPEPIVKYHTLQKSKENIGFASYFNDDWQMDLIKESELLDQSEVLKTTFLENSYSAYFILAELNWHNHAITDFYGIKVAQQLRLNNVKAPIFICSFVPEEYLVKQQNALILKSAGHYFIQIPEGYQQQFKINKLTDMELFDIQLHYCDPAGLIRTIWHRKHAALQKSNLDEGKKYLFGLLSQMRSVEGLNIGLTNQINEVTSRLDNIKAKDGDKNKEDLRLFLDEVTERRFTKHLDKNENEFNAVYTGGWDVLVLDDNPDQVETIISALKRVDKNLKVYLATNYDEAASIIGDDIFNRITLVIVDYVLVDENGYCKQPQGYAFIEWLNRQGRFNEIILLSGQSRTSILSIFKRFGIHVSYRRKTELSGGLFADFIEEIFDKGNKTFEALLSQPSSGIWDFSLANFYKHYRNDPEYHTEEDKICKAATRYVKQIDFYLNLKTGDDTMGWFNTLLKGGIIISPFKDIRRGKLRRTESNLVAPLPQKYGEKDENYETFKNILIIRRIILWLKTQRGITKWSILGDLIFEGVLNPAHSGGGKEKNLMTFSCVSDSDFVENFPVRILVEEKQWLKGLLGIDYNAPEADIVKEKFVFFDLISKKLRKIIKECEVDLNEEKYDDIRDLIFINAINEKRSFEAPFANLFQMLDKEMYFEFLDYFLNHYPSLKKDYIIDRHYNHKQNCLKRTVLVKLSEFTQSMDSLYLKRLGNPRDKKRAYEYTKVLQLLFNNHTNFQKIKLLFEHFDIEYELRMSTIFEIKQVLNCFEMNPEKLPLDDIILLKKETERLIKQYYAEVQE